MKRGKPGRRARRGGGGAVRRALRPHVLRGGGPADADEGVRGPPLLASDEGKRTAAELAEALKVSPAAVSNAVRYLQQVRLVEREREPGERRDHYRVYNDTWYEVVTRRDEMLMRWQGDLRERIEAVGAETPAGKRLEETRRFYAFVHDETPKLMERWRQLRLEG